MVTNKIDRDTLKKELVYLKSSNQAPRRMNLEAYATMQGGLYVFPETNHKETPFEMMWRASKTSAGYLYKHPGIELDFYEAFKRQYLGNATPTVANLGTPNSALPISCFVNRIHDSIDGIFSGLHEAAMLTKVGGGVGVVMDLIRDQTSNITGGGKSNGAVPWGWIFDHTSSVVSQAGVRRGAFTFWFSIWSRDFWDWLLSKDHSKGDPTTHIHSNVGVIIDDRFMDAVNSGDKDAVARWDALNKTRLKSGSPLILYIGNARRDLPSWMVDAGLDVTGTNICTEIISCADFTKTMVCCLVSENLALLDEWRNWVSPNYKLNVHQLAVHYLDGVMSYFIDKSKKLIEDIKVNQVFQKVLETLESFEMGSLAAQFRETITVIPGLEKARNYAINGRPLGVGVFGFGAYLQQHMIPFESKEAENFNVEFFSWFNEELDKASRKLAVDYGCCEWAKTAQRRHIQTSAIAPTVGNSVMAGGVTPGIEPLAANYFQADGSAGSWTRVNPYFIEYLERNGRKPEEIDDILDSVIDHGGSVQHFDNCIVDDYAKRVFKRADEIDQRYVVKHAVMRQPFIEQTQSVNLWFSHDADAEYVSDVHMMAYQGGLPTLYYLRGDSIGKSALRSDVTKDAEIDGDLGEIQNLVGEPTYLVITKEGCDFCEKAKGLLKSEGLMFRTMSHETQDWYSYLEKNSSQEFADQVYHHGSFPRIIAEYYDELIFIGGYDDLQAARYNVNNVKPKFEICEACDG